MEKKIMFPTKKCVKIIKFAMNHSKSIPLPSESFYYYSDALKIVENVISYNGFLNKLCTLKI